MRFGLVAHRKHGHDADGALAGWARNCEGSIRALGLGLHAVGGTYDALARHGLLAGHAPLVRLPSGVEGGVMRLASCIAGGLAPEHELDGVIYFMDPVDPSSLYPETQALKRQCVIHGKPFVSTAAGAAEWITVECVHAGVGDAAELARPLAGQTVALIAHDALKPRMLEFAATHFELLSRFSERVGTGTTGGLLNELAWSRGWPAGQPWVTRYQSGPLGGDAQIAGLVAEGKVEAVFFFVDPLAKQPHDPDIQGLLRICNVHNVALATNTATALYIITNKAI